MHWKPVHACIGLLVAASRKAAVSPRGQTRTEATHMKATLVFLKQAFYSWLPPGILQPQQWIMTTPSSHRFIGCFLFIRVLAPCTADPREILNGCCLDSRPLRPRCPMIYRLDHQGVAVLSLYSQWISFHERNIDLLRTTKPSVATLGLSRL